MESKEDLNTKPRKKKGTKTGTLQGVKKYPFFIS